MNGLDQIMAENRVVRKAPRHRPLERVHVIDPLADEGSLLKNVLIDIRYRLSVGIDAHVARKEAHEPGAPCARQPHADARLKNTVALGDDARRGVELRLVQGVSDRADELKSRLSRKLGVGVEGNDILDRGQNRTVADHFGEVLLSAAAQERVEIRQFSPFALLSHPLAFPLVPMAGTMKEKKDVTPVAPIFFGERLDAGFHLAEQSLVVRHDLQGGIDPDPSAARNADSDRGRQGSAVRGPRSGSPRSPRR